MLEPGQYGELRTLLGRRLLTSYGARANAAQGLRVVRRDQSDREAAARAVAQTRLGATREQLPSR